MNIYSAEKGSRKLSAASRSNAWRINISFAFISATLPLPRTQLLKPFDGAPAIPRDGMPTDGVAGESSQDENNSVDRKNLPSLDRLSPSTLLPSSGFLPRVRPHYLPRDMTTTIIKCVARAAVAAAAAPSCTNDHRNCTVVSEEKLFHFFPIVH